MNTDKLNYSRENTKKLLANDNYKFHIPCGL